MPSLSRISLAVAIALVLVESHVAIAAEPRVELEIALEGNSIPAEARSWTEMLTQAGFSSVRIRGGQGDSPSLEASGTPQSPRYRVVGVLTPSNQLLVPKGRFGLNDRSGVEQWLKKLRDFGEEGISIKPVAFGLLPRQLVAVHEALAVRVEKSTLGRPSREVAKQIADRLTYKFIADGSAQRALASDDAVADELQGLTCGTALAAILRPLGLVMFPERNGPDLRLRLLAARDAKEFWPVGWPPKGNPSETVPEFFKFLKVEISDIPLTEAMLAIADRLKTPLLVDHNSLARDRVDLQTKVNFPATNIYYARALDRLLFQAKLKYEIRVDEAEKPFLWITTLKQ